MRRSHPTREVMSTTIYHDIINNNNNTNCTYNHTTTTTTTTNNNNHTNNNNNHNKTTLIMIITTIHILIRIIKRGHAYGVRAPVFYGNLREQTGQRGLPRVPSGSLCCSYRYLRKYLKPPGVYGRL